MGKIGAAQLLLGGQRSGAGDTTGGVELTATSARNPTSSGEFRIRALYGPST